MGVMATLLVLDNFKMGVSRQQTDGVFIPKTVTTKIERPNAVSIYQLVLGLVPCIATYACSVQKQDGYCIHRAIN